jgi:beta-galactosidase
VQNALQRIGTSAIIKNYDNFAAFLFADIIFTTMNKNILLAALFAVLLNYAQGRQRLPFNDGWMFKKAEDLPKSLGEQWQSVDIPHTWNAQDMQTKRNSYYAGAAYYKRTMNASRNLSDKRIFLRFEGVASVAEVYVNGALAGSHSGAFSAFAVEIGKLLKYDADNEILVKVDNAARPDVIPINHTLFGVYGGIYRNVELIVTEKMNIAVSDYASSGIYIRQKNVSAKSAEVYVKIKVENKNHDAAAASALLLTTIYESDGRVKARQQTNINVPPQGRQFFEHSFTIKNPHLWQGLDDPYLYGVEVQLVYDGKTIDEVRQPLGLRHFELKNGDGMYLNGRKVPMYGVCRHQDWLQYGSALSDEQHDADLAIIKELGATTIRFAHYQQAERIYAKCDSIGFIVWAEIPFVNRVSTQEAGNAKQQLTELIRQNYNHPCIYVWGLHNEVYSPYDYTAALTAALHDLAKTEDPDRYTASVSGYSSVDNAANLNADIQGINHYFGWYSGEVGDVKKWVEGMERNFPNYKIIFSEYGAEANIMQQQEEVADVGDCCGFDKNYNEQFATHFHEQHWGIISRHPYLLASYVWNTFDFATPASSQGGVEARNMKGLVTFDRKVKKDPYYWYKANWSKQPTLYITQRRAVQRKRQTTQITIYSNLGKPRVLLNGRELTAYQMGTTAVHYIFTDVKLDDGVNIIEAALQKDGREYSDRIEWHYSADSRHDAPVPQPQKNTKEHAGL